MILLFSLTSVLVFIYFFIQNYIKVKNKRLLYICVSMLLIGFLLAFKSTHVGADTPTYIKMYSLFGISFSSAIKIYSIEYGFAYLLKFLNYISNNVRLLFIIEAVLVGISYGYLFYKKSSNLLITILAYLSFGFFAFQLTGIRQSISLAITLFSFEYIEKRKFLNFLCIIVFASLFHASALFFIPAYFVGQMNNSSRSRNIILLIGILITINLDFFTSIAINTSERYANYGIESTGNGLIFFLVILVITIYLEIYKKKILKIKPEYKVYYNINYISCILWLERLITRTAERVSFYYLPATIICLSAIALSTKDKENANFIQIIVVILLFVLFIYRIRGLEYSFYF